jgi:hypothetical protein
VNTDATQDMVSRRSSAIQGTQVFILRRALGAQASAAAVVPLPGPGREQHEDFRSLVARDRVALVGLEVGKRPCLGFDLLAARADPRVSGYDEHPGVLFDLVVAELLSCIQADQNRARLVLAQ